MNTSHATPEDQVQETEEQLVSRAQEAISQSRWVVGECATRWTRRYARGRTDADFGALIGLTGDQVYQRRRVWETFHELQPQFTFIKWSHFYTVLNWDDARECLQWAEDTKSTVAEMKAWRRAVRGEDLTTDPLPEELEGSAVQFLPTETSWVQDPATFGSGPARNENREPSRSEDDRNRLSAARQLGEGGEEYTPFRQGAASPAPEAGHAGAAVAEVHQPSADQLARRMASTLERCVKVMTPEFAREFRKLPEPVRDRLIKAVGELSARVGDLM